MMAKIPLAKKMPNTMATGIVGFHVSVVRRDALQEKKKQKTGKFTLATSGGIQRKAKFANWGNISDCSLPLEGSKFLFSKLSLCKYELLGILELLLSLAWRGFCDWRTWLRRVSEPMRAFVIFFFHLVWRIVPSSQSQLHKCGWIVSSQSQWLWWEMIGSR